MAEFSKTVKFDFPRIPVLGTLLLIITIINYGNHITKYIIDSDGRPSISVIATAILALGTAGVSVSHLVSMVMFDVLFPIKKIINKTDRNYRTSYHWFRSIQEHAVPIVRQSDRDGDHCDENRLSINKLNNKQVHATLHALEMQCREKSPSFGVQLEYYYSLYIFFFMSSLYVLIIFFVNMYNIYILEERYVSNCIIFVDILIFSVCFIGTFRARKIKEHLRITLFNHDRRYVIELLEKWYQCKI